MPIAFFEHGGPGCRVEYGTLRVACNGCIPKRILRWINNSDIEIWLVVAFSSAPEGNRNARRRPVGYKNVAPIQDRAPTASESFTASTTRSICSGVSSGNMGNERNSAAVFSATGNDPA